MYCSPEINIHKLVHDFQIEICKKCPHRNTGIIHKYVYTPISFYRLRDEIFAIFQLTYICFYSQGFISHAF